jgi:hypothetical protein
MFVQHGNVDSDVSEIAATTAVEWASPTLVDASSLLSNCDCPVEIHCNHRSACIRMLAIAEAGLVPSCNNSPKDDLIKSLDLDTESKRSTFFELFGYWLSAGSMTYCNDGDEWNAIMLSQVTNADNHQFLSDTLSLCGLISNTDWHRFGETIVITNQRWFEWFDNEYSSKQKDSLQHKDSRRERRLSFTCTDEVSVSSMERASINSSSSESDLLSESWTPCERNEKRLSDDLEYPPLPEPTKAINSISNWMMHSISPAEIQAIVRGLHRVDGQLRLHKDGSQIKSIYSSSTKFRDQLMQLMLHAGFSVYSDLMYRSGTIRGYVVDGKIVSVSKATGLHQLNYPIETTSDVWSINWVVSTDDTNNNICMPSMIRNTAVKEQVYSRERDGRLWCVEVHHPDHLIFAQRAVRYEGVVTKQSQPIIVGNCQMMRDFVHNERAREMLPYFCEEHYTGVVAREVPSVETICAFLRKVFEVGQFHSECCVISLIYINRLIGVTGVPLTSSNWKPMAISALVLAQKVWDDTPLINADFSVLYPALSVKEINFLERQFLHILEFKLAVSPALYAQYYFELRSIGEENIMHSTAADPLFPITRPNAAAVAAASAAGTHVMSAADGAAAAMRTLPKALLKRIEARSHLIEDYQRDKRHYKKRSTTVEDIQMRHSRLIVN